MGKIVYLIILITQLIYAALPISAPARLLESNGNVYRICDYTETEMKFLEEFSKGNDSYTLYDASVLDADILESRKGTVIVERCIGLVTETDNEMHGIILNANDENYNYIGYSNCTENLCEGTMVLTYFVYNANNNYVDDIVERYDFVICREYEN